jgi:hypothetical protein
MSCFLKELVNGQSQRKDGVSFSFALFSLLDLFTLEAVPISCPETLVQNYHPVLHNIPEQKRSHMMIC